MSRKIFFNWSIRVFFDWLKLLHKLFLEKLHQKGVLHGDETCSQILIRPNDKSVTLAARIWRNGLLDLSLLDRIIIFLKQVTKELRKLPLHIP